MERLSEGGRKDIPKRGVNINIRPFLGNIFLVKKITCIYGWFILRDLHIQMKNSKQIFKWVSILSYRENKKTDDMYFYLIIIDGKSIFIEILHIYIQDPVTIVRVSTPSHRLVDMTIIAH